MKKIFLFCFAISALLFTSCEETEDAMGYTLVISPSTASISAGDTITLTIDGENASDYLWEACYEPTTDGASNGSCLVIMGGTASYSASIFNVGSYKFHAANNDLGVDTGYVTLTVVE